MENEEHFMRKIDVLINAPEKAVRLCEILSSHNSAFDLAKGSYTVDGKSILGICSMDLSVPLTLTVYDEQDFAEDEIREFMVVR